MKKVYMLPTPTQAAHDTSNSINQIVLRLQRYLPQFGWEIVEQEQGADLIAGHAGQTTSKTPVDVAHSHGLYWTATEKHTSKWHWAANEAVLNNLRQAREITVPSDWVAETLRRDMHINPRVIGWAIEHDEWQPGINQGYVLWAKTRADGACDPAPVNQLAGRNPGVRFVSTFGNAAANVQVIGRQSFEAMKDYIQGAGVYLATTKETFGITTLEAMWCGVPVLGYRHGGNVDIAEHGVTGYLAEPGNIDDLHNGLQFCLKYRDILGANAREAARGYTWDKVAEQFAQVYDKALVRPEYKLAVVIPVYNYAKYLPEAIQSVLHQKTDFPVKVIVVDDCSTDDSKQVAIDTLANHAKRLDMTVVSTPENSGPAGARNLGIILADAEYVLTLDADDQLRHDAPVLQTLADALDADCSLGIAYTGLMPIGADNQILHSSGWPGAFSFERQIKGSNQVPTCAMFRKEAWRRAGGYKGQFTPAEDAALWLDITALGYAARQVTTEPWFVYRMHDSSLSHAVRTMRQREPNWRLPHIGWITNGHRPMAAPVPPDSPTPTNAVRNYDRPDFSIIIPVGPNHTHLVKEALDSIAAQTLWNWETIVVFDFDYVMPPDEWSGYPWPRFLWTDGGVGAGAARNLGAKAARGRLLAFLDADDMLHPEFLEATYRAFRTTGRYVYTDWVSIGKDGTPEVHECPNYDAETLFRKQSIHSVSVLIPRVDFLTVGGFDEDMIAWEDVDLYMKLAVNGYCGQRVARPLLTYRYQTGSRREDGEQIKDELKALLYERYQPFMKGETMCACDEKPRKTDAPILDESNPDVMRVRMDSADAPTAKRTIRGASGQQYGRRQKGDIFLIMRKDFDGLRHLVSPYQEFDVLDVVPEPLPPPVPVVEMA